MGIHSDFNLAIRMKGSTFTAVIFALALGDVFGTINIDPFKPGGECSCEPYKYLCSGVVPLGKGDVVCSFNFWARQYKVEFDIKVTKELPGKSTYYNVFHMTIGGDQKQYGDRIPAVWVNSDKYFHIASAVSGNPNLTKNIKYALNQWYHFEIIQEENSKGEVIYSIVMDGLTVYQVFNTLPQRFEKVILYTSDPFFQSFAPFGELANLNIVNLG